MIYFVQTTDNQYIKIGYASDVDKRVAGLKTSSPLGLKLLAVQPGDVKLERALHERFRYLRTRGEWFETGPALVEYAAQAALLTTTGIDDADPFLRYCILEPRLIPLFVEAASTRDDVREPGFCANEVFFRYHNHQAGLKARLSRLVGWHADDPAHPDLMTPKAYDAVYDRIYEALPNCRNCRCFPIGDFVPGAR